MYRTAVAMMLILSGVVLAQAPAPRVLQHPFYPLKVGHRWYYKSGDQAVLVRADKIDNMDMKKADKKSGEVKTEIVPTFRLEILSGPIDEIRAADPTRIKTLRVLAEHVAVLEDGVYRFTGAGKEILPPLRFFRLDLKDGDTWECNSSSDGVPIKGTFKSTPERIQVLGRSYDTVTAKGTLTIGNKPMDVTYWFAADIGMVKQTVKVGDYESTLELIEFVPAK